MPRKLPAPPIGSADDVETEFYEALQAADLDRLMAVWSDDDDIWCVHPGGPRLIGAAAIRASFEAIFANGAIAARADQVRRVETLGSAVHSVLERLRVRVDDRAGEAFVVATNVYLKGPRGWRMVCHHASPGTAAEVVVGAEASATLH
jgi:ketosteroid isomerase-like protein